MRIGYLFNGHLGDVKLGPDGQEISTPDGNATYSWTIEHECERRGYKLIPLGEDRDMPAASHLGGEALFASHSQRKRLNSYARMLVRGWGKVSDRKFPELDLVLVEWRWPIPGRNTPEDKGKPGYQGDLERQDEVLHHYGELDVPIVVWDLDHKFTPLDYEWWTYQCGYNVELIETSVKPRPVRTRVHPPCLVRDLLQHDIDERLPSHHLGYIGSRYERDEVIDRWINPISPPHTHRTKFWGKWEPADDVRARWPGVTFGPRIGVRDFYASYSRVAAVPLLAKQSYLDTGFVTPRMAEAVLFGTVPVGLAGHHGIEEYVTHVAKDPADLLARATYLRNVSPIRRRVLREEAAHRLSHTDVRNFVDVLEGLGSGTASEAVDAAELVEKETDAEE